MTICELDEVLTARDEEKVFQEKLSRARGANRLIKLLCALSPKKIPESEQERLFNSLVDPQKATDDLEEYRELIAESEERARQAAEAR